MRGKNELNERIKIIVKISSLFNFHSTKLYLPLLQKNIFV